MLFSKTLDPIHDPHEHLREYILRVGCVLIGIAALLTAITHAMSIPIAVTIYLSVVTLLCGLIFLFCSRDYYVLGSFLLNSIIFSGTVYFAGPTTLLSTATGSSLIIPICLLGITTRFRYGLALAAFSVLALILISVTTATPWSTSTNTTVTNIAIVTLLLYFVERLNETIRRQNIELKEAHEKLTELALAEERTRIAREIHDSLGSHVMALTNLLKGVRKTADKNSPEAEVLLTSALDVSKEAMADIRLAVKTLRDSDIEQRTLVQLVAAFEHNTDGIEVLVQHQGTPYDLPLPITGATYRIIQEAMTNVRKHAAATQACIELDYRDPNVFRFSVSDNGRGASSLEGGFGLIGIRERVQKFRGHVSIETLPVLDHGFRLHVGIPL